MAREAILQEFTIRHRPRRLLRRRNLQNRRPLKKCRRWKKCLKTNCSFEKQNHLR